MTWSCHCKISRGPNREQCCSRHRCMHTLGTYLVLYRIWWPVTPLDHHQSSQSSQWWKAPKLSKYREWMDECILPRVWDVPTNGQMFNQHRNHVGTCFYSMDTIIHHIAMYWDVCACWWMGAVPKIQQFFTIAHLFDSNDGSKKRVMNPRINHSSL